MVIGRTLSPEDREAIRAMRRDNPKMRYWQIAEEFDVSTATVCICVNEKPPRPVIVPPQAAPMVRESTFIRPLPEHLLRAGDGKCARRPREPYISAMPGR